MHIQTIIQNGPCATVLTFVKDNVQVFCPVAECWMAGSDHLSFLIFPAHACLNFPTW